MPLAHFTAGNEPGPHLETLSVFNTNMIKKVKARAYYLYSEFFPFFFLGV